MKNEEASPDWPIAEQQFGAIATNKGTEKPALFNIDTSNPDEFQSTGQTIAQAVSTVIAGAQKTGTVDPQAVAKSSQPGGSGDGIPVASQAGAENDATVAQPSSVSDSLPTTLPAEVITNINTVIAAALVDYLGSKEGKPPRDVTAWVMDRDLVDPRMKSLDVRLLINRDDLSSLILAVERVTDALATAELTQMKFFESLKSIITQGVKGETISFEKAQTLAEAKLTGEEKLLPKWIEGLPYKSAIQEMSDEKFEAMTPDQRADLDKSLRAKLQFYKDISEKVDAWQPLNDADKDSSTSKVYPLKLDDLP